MRIKPVGGSSFLDKAWVSFSQSGPFYRWDNISFRPIKRRRS